MVLQGQDAHFVRVLTRRNNQWSLRDLLIRAECQTLSSQVEERDSEIFILLPGYPLRYPCVQVSELSLRGPLD